MVRTVTSTTLTLQTDFVDSPPPIHCGGILAGSSPSSGPIFCWIANPSSHLSVAVDHLTSKNYDSEALEFIPYSAKDAWAAAYPFANPSLEVNADGQLVQLIQHSLTSEQLGRLIASGNSNTIHYDPEAAELGSGDASKKVMYPQLQQRKKHKRAGMELLSNSVLTNAERDVLHVEIFKYFAWLKVALEEVEVTHAGKRTLGNACATSVKVQECCDVIESAFAVVKKNVDGIGNGGASSSTPLLEKVLGEELAKLVVKVPLRLTGTLFHALTLLLGGGSHKREQGDFEEYWARLIEFKEKNGHSNVPVRYKEDLKLGKWISNIRQKRKSLDSQGLEACEPKPKKGPNLGAVTLTKDRIDRFNAIDFAWNLSGPNPRQSWEERFEQMMEYYRENGRWPPHSHGTLGE
ncbi:hypothetical protein ACHAWO_012138 [Cyclotella atomus]|uniref:Helicase-associated domain-containing protein n=1 Tax=Cyclotella atomus TaxID=382360 RepID=A0ABD3NTR2_9STRA